MKLRINILTILFLSIALGAYSQRPTIDKAVPLIYSNDDLNAANIVPSLKRGSEVVWDYDRMLFKYWNRNTSTWVDKLDGTIYTNVASPNNATIHIQNLSIDNTILSQDTLFGDAWEVTTVRPNYFQVNLGTSWSSKISLFDDHLVEDKDTSITNELDSKWNETSTDTIEPIKNVVRIKGTTYIDGKLLDSDGDLNDGTQVMGSDVNGNADWVDVQKSPITHILPKDNLLDSASLTKYFADNSIEINVGDKIVQRGVPEPITSRVPIDQGSIRDRYAAFPTMWCNERVIYVLYREGDSHTVDGNVRFARSYDNGLTWTMTQIASNPDASTEYGLASSGLYVNESGKIFVTYRRGINYDTNTVPIFDDSDSYFVSSDDEGYTWSAPIEIDPGGKKIFSETKTIKVGSRHLHPYYISGGSGVSCGVAYSDNEDFSTWTYVEFPSPASATPGSGGLTEVSLVQNGGQIIAFIRTSNPNTTRITRSVSNDVGLTWSAPTDVIYPPDYIASNGAHPNSILLPNGQLLTHARHNTQQYQAILVSDDLGNTYHTMLLSEPNELSMYMDFHMMSDNKIGVVSAYDISGFGSDVYFSSIDLPKSTVIEKTVQGYEVISLSSKGQGLNIGDIYNVSEIGKPLSEGFGFGNGMKESRLVDLGDGKQLHFGSDSHPYLMVLRGDNAGNEKISIAAPDIASVTTNTNKKLDVFGQIGAGNKSTDVLVIGHNAYTESETTNGIFSNVIGVAAASNSTSVRTSNIVGRSVGQNATFSSANVMGYNAGINASGAIASSELIGSQSFAGPGITNIGNVISIGKDNGRNATGAINNRVWIGNNYRYYNGDNSLLIGNGMIIGTGNALNNTDNLFKLGMDSDVLMEATIGEKFVQINDILRLPDASTLPTGYTATAGDIRWNATDGKHQGYDGTTWNNMY